MALEVTGSLEDVVSRVETGSVMPRLNQIMGKLLADALNSGEAQSAILERDCIVRVAWFDVPDASKRKIYVYRRFGSPASEQEAKIVARASKLQWYTLERHPVENPRGWIVTESPELEAQAEDLRAATKARNAAQEVSRVDYALGLKLKLCPQHEDSVAGYLELWRDGLEQFPHELEGKIAGFEAALAARRAAPVVVSDAGQSEAML